MQMSRIRGKIFIDRETMGNSDLALAMEWNGMKTHDSFTVFLIHSHLYVQTILPISVNMHKS